MSSVSVVIPTWNRARLVARAIESALAQSPPVLEVIVCDDGSSDNTREIVARLSVQDPRVKWSAGLRGGRPAIPRNRGIRESRGDWIAFLDSDDEWLPGKLSAQLDLARRLGCSAACSNALRVMADGREGSQLLNWHRERLSFGDLLDVNGVICSSAIAHRSALEEAGGFPEGPEFKAIEDYALWLRLSMVSDFAYCSDPLLRYTDDPASSLRGEQAIQPEIQKLHVLGYADSWVRASKRGRWAGLWASARIGVRRRGIQWRLR